MYVSQYCNSLQSHYIIIAKSRIFLHHYGFYIDTHSYFLPLYAYDSTGYDCKTRKKYLLICSVISTNNTRGIPKIRFFFIISKFIISLHVKPVTKIDRYSAVGFYHDDQSIIKSSSYREWR